MAMDRFLEEVVVRKKGQVLAKVMYSLAWVVVIVSALFASVMLTSLFSSFSIVTLILILIMAGLAFLFYRQKDSLRSMEYEYTFTNGQMDFARVLGNVRRKHLLSLSLRDVESGGRVTNPNFDRYASMRDIKRYEYYLNPDVKLAYLFFIKEGNKHLLIFEPSDAMCEMIAGVNPRVFSFS